MPSAASGNLRPIVGRQRHVLTAALSTCMASEDEEAAFYALWRAEFPCIRPERGLGRSSAVHGGDGSPEVVQAALPHR